MRFSVAESPPADHHAGASSSRNVERPISYLPPSSKRWYQQMRCFQLYAEMSASETRLPDVHCKLRTSRPCHDGLRSGRWRGSRLMELTDKRVKPAVFFGGKSRPSRRVGRYSD